MPFSDDYEYPRVKIKRESEAWQVIAREAADYGKTEGEFIADLAIAWTKMMRGQWNPLWPVQMMASPSYGNGNGMPLFTPGAGAQESDEERRRREEAVKRREETRLAAARAELLDD